jgi:hypothetical protein
MPYTPDTPLPTDYLNTISQPIFRQNFNQLNISFGIDHYPFSDLTANNGYHKQVSLTNLATPVSLPVGTNVKGIFYTNIDNNNINQAFFYNGTNNFQITPCLPVRVAVNFTGAAVIQGTAFNVATVTGTNPYTITFTNPTPSVNYLPFASIQDTSANPTIVKWNRTSLVTGSLVMSVVNQNGTLVSAGSIQNINIMIYGG